MISINNFLKLCCLLACCLTIAVFYPGYVSPDSIEQLREGRSFAFAGLHPLVFALLWHYLDRVIPGPAHAVVGSR